MISHSNNDFDFEIFANKNSNAPNFNFVNEPDLTRILQFEILVHQINIAILGFLTSPPPEGTHQVELLSQRSAEEEATSLHLILEEVIGVVEVSDFKEVIEAFDQPQAPESSGATFSHFPPI